MGAFDLPTGELELLLKDSKGEHWESVAFTDSVDDYDIVDSVEDWSVNHTVLAARFNGKPVKIPDKYHWELRHRDECFGKFPTRNECVDAMHKRKSMWRKDKTVKVGLPVFVKD